MAALGECVGLAGSDTGHELLTLVSAELERRENPVPDPAEHSDPRFVPRSVLSRHKPARNRAGS